MDQPGSFADRFWMSDDGLTLHARDYAAARGPARLPVICIHGLTRNARDFEDLAPWLAARHHRVLVADVRGRGLSQWDPEIRYRPEVYADDITRMCTALGIARAHFIGTSMGGIITMELAGLHPDLIASVVINDVGPVLASAALRRISSNNGAAPVIRNWSDAANYMRSINGQALPHYTPADWLRMARRTFREQEGTLAPDYDPAIAKPLRNAAGAISADPQRRWEALAHDRPVLLLRGEVSDLLTPEAAEAMAAGRANVVLRTVAGVGHAPMLDEPDAMAALIEHFEALD